MSDVKLMTKEELAGFEPLRSAEPQSGYVVMTEEDFRRLRATALAGLEDRELLEWLEAEMANPKAVFSLDRDSLDQADGSTDMVLALTDYSGQDLHRQGFGLTVRAAIRNAKQRAARLSGTPDEGTTSSGLAPNHLNKDSEK